MSQARARGSPAPDSPPTAACSCSSPRSSSCATAAAAVVTPPSSLSRTTPSPGPNPSRRRMETALDVLQRALQGDAGARSFLDQTANIYVLDVNVAADETPKLYGCWNFLHHGLNEFDRLSSGNDGQRHFYPAEQWLLAQFALKVARRSNAQDQRLVQTCIDNYTSYIT
eukprot:CAMPEP_0178828274 /NCGR_PEP_ID=MMETSP0746-20121128/7737_1 /TAXON_ID=913974 /ORGANISM="Nitzschia punctata, Strain CCMP561" /LENGTH=168 /DNA_ID=CAMNT_0020490233 /DNA_START=500 /DNA_END=1002 /DNA_ORIENTATION=+